ncbi:hypothetical protein [Rubellicoccus peritrichatus]|uniref:Uncharacterized protein n=1 Tax=Rubellicoccus peritrichatus TaxID=3080537 RepID=A0AAQ3LJE3_9BACT|nr:hypothetical protein [Puniceicoccus sp. CR14]WOO43294.1 hypothetical protein RZN69_09345 [Puniceicoccus sp. CR14]
MKTTISTLLILTSATALNADMLELRNGQVLQGTYAGGTIATVRFESNNDIKSYPVSEVAAISFDQKDGANPLPSATTGVARPMAVEASAGTTAASISVPAGTPLLVSLQQELDSGKSKKGQEFSATLAANLMSGNTVVAPAGSIVKGRIDEVKSAGRLRKEASIAFSLTEIIINGKTYPINTTEQSQSDKERGGMLKGAAGGAARGSIFGAITDNDVGDSAAGGAAAGAAGGLLRKGNQVVYQKGTVLSFNLTQPLSVN